LFFHAIANALALTSCVNKRTWEEKTTSVQDYLRKISGLGEADAEKSDASRERAVGRRKKTDYDLAKSWWEGKTGAEEQRGGNRMEKYVGGMESIVSQRMTGAVNVVAIKLRWQRILRWCEVN